MILMSFDSFVYVFLTHLCRRYDQRWNNLYFGNEVPISPNLSKKSICSWLMDWAH